MISAVGESAQVALQASTIAPLPRTAAAAKVEQNPAEKSTEALGGGGRGKGDSVAISAKAQQLTSAALNATDESQKSSNEKSKEESTGKK